MNADGTYTVRDKDHANRLMRDGCHGYDYTNRRMVLAAVMWFKENDAAGYNYGSISKMCKAAESKIATADKALTSIHKALETFESVPGVHHLVNAVTESIDLGNAQKCLPVFIYGQYGVSKTEFLKAVVGRVFGGGVYQVNALKAIAHVEHLLVRNSVLLFDDFTWSVTANGTLMNIESVKGLLTQEDSSETRELLGRVGESARVPHYVIKMGSCNCASFEDWYGEKVAPQHLGAIMRRINFINLHEFELPSGEVVWISAR